MIDAQSESNTAIVWELPGSLTAGEAFRRLAHLPHVIYLDSAQQGSPMGRYSFIAADPFDWIEATCPDGDVLNQFIYKWTRFRAPAIAGLPPFQGGVAGLFAYDLARSLERIPEPRTTDFPVPDLAVGFYDTLLAFDHQENQGWLISRGIPETEPLAQRARAERRLEQFQRCLRQPPLQPPRRPVSAIARSNLAPQFDLQLGDVTSNLSRSAYENMVRRAVDYIYAGDIFQVNLSQRLLSPAKTDPVSLYFNLRDKNPAPYAGYFDLGEWQICSSSPECFLRVRDRIAETRPIKGTRGRSPSPEGDLFVGDELQLSEKDRAENVMIVDLMRNDFSRVCTSGSVQVTELCSIETYAHVKHLVSAVRGELPVGTTPFDVLWACFPGGSITGAPKIRAMEIIAELEPTARGAYCGSLGYIGFDGQMDSSILIRTITVGRGWWQLPVGGGIVAQSDPHDEYQETWQKARGLLHALELC